MTFRMVLLCEGAVALSVYDGDDDGVFELNGLVMLSDHGKHADLVTRFGRVCHSIVAVADAVVQTVNVDLVAEIVAQIAIAVLRLHDLGNLALDIIFLRRKLSVGHRGAQRERLRFWGSSGAVASLTGASNCIAASVSASAGMTDLSVPSSKTRISSHASHSSFAMGVHKKIVYVSPK